MKDKIEALVRQYIPSFKVNNENIYTNAFVHKSAIRDVGCASNERLEFVGDSVLGLIIAKYLYEKYPNENEGFLTRVRTKIVSGQSLAKIARNLGLDQFMIMNEKAMTNEWNTNPRILEDAMESLIGAIFLDHNLDVATSFVLKVIQTHIEEETMLKDTNYKDGLMKLFNSKSLPQPVYTIKTENGPDHNKIFTVQILVEGKVVAEGFEKNKKQAEQKAAQRLLRSFDIE